jgi:hypothetical protein
VARTYTQMRVNGSIANSTNQLLVLTKRDVIFGLGIAILLGETKINYIDLVATHSKSHVEGVRFDIPVDEKPFMYTLDTRDKLICKQEHRLQRKLAVAAVQVVL